MTYPFQIPTHSAMPAAIVLDSRNGEGFFARPLSGSDRLSFDEKRTITSVLGEKSLSDRLFDAVAEAKKWTSRVAMRLEPDTRKRVFAQLDRLHDEEEWHDSSKPVALESYKTFVRAILLNNIGGKSSLALGATGNLTAIWQGANGRLLIEFQPAERVRYLVTQLIDGHPERVAGDTAVSRLPAVLAPFDVEQWYCAA